MSVRCIKTCSVCGVQYQPWNTMQRACSTQCAIRYKDAQKLRKSARAAKQRIEKNDRQKALQKAQQAFNAFIRIRDLGQGCISCGITTGQFHAGHYRTTKSASQLRFNTWAVHVQCSQCNAHKSGNITAYRAALVERIGADRVLALEADQRQVKYSVEYLNRLARIFRKRTRLYQSIKERRCLPVG